MASARAIVPNAFCWKSAACIANEFWYVLQTQRHSNNECVRGRYAKRWGLAWVVRSRASFMSCCKRRKKSVTHIRSNVSILLHLIESNWKFTLPLDELGPLDSIHFCASSFLSLLIIIGWNKASLPLGSLGYVNAIGWIAISAVSVLIAPLGAKLAHNWNPNMLKRAFGIYLVITGAFMLQKSVISISSNSVLKESCCVSTNIEEY